MHGSRWRGLETERGTRIRTLGWDNRPGNRRQHEGPRPYTLAKQPRQSPTLLTHICARARSGRFWVRRITIAKRMRTKLAEVKTQLQRRMHDPIPVQGRWLAQVLQGHVAYYAVPGNSNAVSAFRYQMTLHWRRALRRRSQRGRITWERMGRYATRWLPQVRVMHPYPNVRFAART
jgi:RNA-directed DNA polymerase